VVADNVKHDHRKRARRLGQASLAMSITGIVATVVIIAIAVGVTVGAVADVVNTDNVVSCTYAVGGSCYSSKRYVPSCYYYTAYYCCYSYETYYSGTYCYS
jgi:hypothetical protein